MPLREEKNQPNINDAIQRKKKPHKVHKGKTPSKSKERLSESEDKSPRLKRKKRSPPSVERGPLKKLIMEIPDVTDSDECIKNTNKKLIEELTSESDQRDNDTTLTEDTYDTETDTEDIDDDTRSNTSMEIKSEDEDVTPGMRKMEERFTQVVKKLIGPLQKSIDNYNTTKRNCKTNSKELKTIKTENKQLQTKCKKLERENHILRNRVVKIEDTLLEKNVVMHGIYEDQWEKEPDRRELIIKAIAKTVYDKDPRERLRIARSAKIISTERLGKWSKHKNRPISICFEKKSYVDCLMTNKKFLPKEVFVDRQYCEETENNRCLLRPILKYAQSMDEYARKCKLEHDTLIIKGLHYTVQTLHKLPANLSGFHVSSRSNNDTLCFFGELSPFSNFHDCPIEVENETFHSSEQYIQLQKARYFKDDQLAEEIKNSETALQCKKLGREVLNYNAEKWSEVAEEQCYTGILAKFEQNLELKQMLLSTLEKTIGEGSPDLLWGTGVHLRTKFCLD